MARAAAAGIVPDRPEGDNGPAYLWPESVPAWDAFMGLSTQWVEGTLHAADIVAHVGMLALDADDLRDLYRGVRACERAVSIVMGDRAREQRRRDAAARPR